MDAMHDTFVNLARGAQRLDDRGLSSLLYRIATNVCLNHLRSRRRRPEDLVDDDVLTRIAVAEDPLDGTLSRLWLEHVLQRSPPSSRLIATMYLVDGFTLEEIAAEVGLSTSGVRKRLLALRPAVKELEGIS